MQNTQRKYTLIAAAFLVGWCYLSYHSPEPATTTIWSSQAAGANASFVRYSVGKKQVKSIILSYLPLEQVKVKSQIISCFGLRLQWIKIHTPSAEQFIRIGRNSCAILVNPKGEISVENWDCSKESFEALEQKFNETDNDINAIQIAKSFFSQNQWQIAPSHFKSALGSNQAD